MNGAELQHATLLVTNVVTSLMSGEASPVMALNMTSLVQSDVARAQVVD